MPVPPNCGAMRPFHHVTLNTGHVSQQPRSAVTAEAFDLIGPMVDAEHGEVMPGVFLDLQFPLTPDRKHRRAGAGQFSILPSRFPTSAAVVCMACWSDAMSDEAWSVVVPLYRITKPFLKPLGLWKPLPPKQPRTPWLAVWFLPGLFELPLSIATMLGDVEQCVAWVMVERELTQASKATAA